ncbi:MAG TPA: hypothetical protein VGE40_05905 [Bacilli bacterium]
MAKGRLGFLAVAASLIVILTIASILVLNTTSPISKEDDQWVVAKVNDEPILFHEFKAGMMDHRTETIVYFHEKHDADANHKGFWQQTFGEEVPLEVLKEKALKHLTGIKVQQMLAKEMGVLDDLSYEAFLEQLNKENKVRKERLARKEVIFGPQQYDEKTYFNYVFSNMVIDLKKALAEDRFVYSDHDLVMYYETIKERNFKIQDTITVSRLFVNYSTESSENLPTEAKALEEVELFKKRLNDRDAFEQAAKEITGRNDAVFGYEEHRFESQNRKEDLVYHDSLINRAALLAEGEISEPFKEDYKYCFSIAMVTERIDHGYEKFEEVKELVELLFIDEQYNDLIDQLLDQSRLIIHQDVYDKVRIP